MCSQGGTSSISYIHNRVVKGGGGCLNPYDIFRIRIVSEGGRGGGGASFI